MTFCCRRRRSSSASSSTSWSCGRAGIFPAGPARSRSPSSCCPSSCGQPTKPCALYRSRCARPRWPWGAPQWKMIVQVLYPAARTGHRHRPSARHRPDQRRDGTASLHGSQQPVFHGEPADADGEYPRGDLPVCACTVRGLARAGLGGAFDDAVRLIVSVGARFLLRTRVN